MTETLTRRLQLELDDATSRRAALQRAVAVLRTIPDVSVLDAIGHNRRLRIAIRLVPQRYRVILERLRTESWCRGCMLM